MAGINGNFTLFTNDTGSAGGPTDFVRDAFSDGSLSPSNNTGFSSTVSTNPLGNSFANDDCPRYGAKTLYIKDLVLVEDRSKWINNEPTYLIIFHESFPAIQAYCFGNISLGVNQGQIFNNQNISKFITLKTISDGIGVGGVVRKVAFIVNDDTSATATGQFVVDGVNGGTATFSNLSSDASGQIVNKQSVFVHAAANETYNIHDIRLTANQGSTLKVNGIIAYFENSGANIDLFPGTTYVDKSKIVTTSGATLALPSYGSSLGGKALIYKTQNNGYAMSALSVTTMISIAQGSSGTNLVSVSTGQGASFPAGTAFVVAQGSSMYVGSVISVSTDTLTVSPTLPFGLSNTIYRTWLSGSTLSIDPSFYSIQNTLDFSKVGAPAGVSNPILDPLGKYCVFGSNLGFSTIDSIPALFFKGASGFLQVDGYMAAAEIEFIGGGILNATLSINGLPGYSINAGQTGALKKTVFTSGGPGYKNFVFGPGSSLGTLGIAKINLYKNRRDISVTFGMLAEFETLGAFTERSAINATLMALGTERRIYADQLYLNGGWNRIKGGTFASGVAYIGASTNSVLKTSYFGKNFSILGTAASGGTLVVDGVGVAANFNVVNTVASEGFHTVQYTVTSGTAIIHGFDYSRTVGDFRDLQTILNGATMIPVQNKAVRSEVLLVGGNSHGAGGVADNIRRFTQTLVNTGSAITYLDDANNGMSCTVNEDGFYYMNYIDTKSTGSIVISITKNASSLVTAPGSLTVTEVLTDTGVASNNFQQCSTVSFLKQGDIIRAQDQADSDGTSTSAVRFQMTKIVGI